MSRAETSSKDEGQAYICKSLPGFYAHRQVHAKRVKYLIWVGSIVVGYIHRYYHTKESVVYWRIFCMGNPKITEVDYDTIGEAINAFLGELIPREEAKRKVVN